MEKKIHAFFQSGLLDKYILDETSAFRKFESRTLY